MKKTRIAIASLMLAVFLGSANAQAPFKDVPAGHWAKQAVEFISQCGLIEGFPDGTFRGNQNLTRYQAALIFFRYIQNGSKSCPGMDAQGQTAVAAGMDEVKKELDDLKARFDALEKTTQDHDARLAKLEADVTKAIDASQKAAEFEARIAKLEADLTAAQSAQEATQKQAQAALDAANAAKAAPAPAAAGPSADDLKALQTRLDALEAQVKQLGQAPAAAAPQDLSGIEKRLTALEDQMKAMPSADRVAALETQVKTLNDTVNSLQGQVNDLKKAQQPAPQPQAQQPAPPQPAPQPELKPVTPTAPAASAPRPRNFYIGAGVGLNDALGSSPLYAGGFVGLRNLFLGLGVRAGADFSLSSSASDAQVFLTRDLNAGGAFNPYLGLGATIGLSGDTNIYGTGLVGVDLNLLGPVGLFAEATPGFGPAGSFRLGARGGLKVNF